MAFGPARPAATSNSSRLRNNSDAICRPREACTSDRRQKTNSSGSAASKRKPERPREFDLPGGNGHVNWSTAADTDTIR